ncbi:MAG: metallophosphoesterase [Comamonadaceae bacterium]|nr:MAG: metallophosphoesterase [Comamonadaceae bacterium]
MGEELLQRRLAMEGEQDAHHYRRASDAFRLEHLASAGPLIRAVLTLTGLRARGRRNMADIRVRRNEVVLASLPAAFDGFTLLHASDLHLDLSAAHASVLAQRVRGLACDACVLTGDYRFAVSGPGGAALAALRAFVPVLPAPAYAVLGNHDGIALAPGLEALGVRVLMNENVALERGGERLHLAGIDDAHYFRTHDIARAAQGIPPDGCAILLSHTPQPYREAEEGGFALMLSGHTHGGQICLPGGIPILTDCPAPRALARGPWRHGGLAGYTSAGCGCSIVDARFHCPPEVTLHTLRRAR